MSEYTAPHVHTAVAKILKELAVEKGGQLPANMGNKPYITAVDISNEVKRQFVANDLILIPHEEVEEVRYIDFTEHNKRLHVAIVIVGRYEIQSTVDGSSLTIQGIGDGLAIGTAVASNIASTNALKNALLRFLLITEQSAEDQAKQGTEAVEAAPQSKATRAVNRAKVAPARPNNSDLENAKQAVRDAWKTVHADDEGYQENGYMALGNSKFKRGWASSVEQLTELAKAITDGEVA